MKHYLWILKITHGGADLDGTLEMAKGALDPDLQCVPALNLQISHVIITKITHRGANLGGTLQMAKACCSAVLHSSPTTIFFALAGGTCKSPPNHGFLALCRWHLYDLLNNRSAWWAPGKIVDLRRRLEPIWRVC